MERSKARTAALIAGSILIGAALVPAGAFAAQMSKVFVTNDSSHPVPVQEKGTSSVAQAGTWNVGISGTASVKSSDVATVIAQGSVNVSPNSHYVLNPNAAQQDVSGYRDVSLYWTAFSAPSDIGIVSITTDGSPYPFAFDQFTPTDLRGVKTYDPAPSTLTIWFENNSSTNTAQLDYTLVGRPN